MKVRECDAAIHSQQAERRADGECGIVIGEGEFVATRKVVEPPAIIEGKDTLRSHLHGSIEIAQGLIKPTLVYKTGAAIMVVGELIAW